MILSLALLSPATVIAVDGCRYSPDRPPCTITSAPDLRAERGSGRVDPKKPVKVAKFTPVPNPEPVGTSGTGTRNHPVEHNGTLWAFIVPDLFPAR